MGEGAWRAGERLRFNVMNPPRFWLSIGLALFLRTVSGATPSLTANLDRDVVGLGESVTLTISLEGAAGNEMPRFPAVTGMRIAGGGRGSRFEFNNGVQRTYLDVSYQLTPQRLGEYRIGPITVVSQGRLLQTGPLKLTAVKPDNPAAGGGGEGNAAFLSLELPNRPVYVGETLIARIWLNAAPRSELRQVPRLQADGFTVGKIQASNTQTTIQTNNRVYSRALFMVPLTAARTGNLAVQATDCIVDVPVATRRRRASDFFDSVFDSPFFGLQETRRFNVSTEPAVIRVAPLPQDHVPPAFDGAVGDFSIALTASPTNVQAGDPITIRVDIGGRGNFDSVHLPEQHAWRGFRTYPPTATFESQDPSETTGTKHFEQVVTPESAAIRELPPLAFAYFSPAAGEYKTVETAPVPLTVAPGAKTPVIPEPTGTPTPPAKTPELAPLKPHLGVIAAGTIPWTTRPWFFGLVAVPWAGWAGMRLWRRWQERSAANLEGRRRRQAEKRIDEGMASLAECSRRGDSAAFFAALFRVLQEIIGAKVQQPPASITEGVLDAELPARGVPEPVVTEFHRLFRACNQARYAPVTDPSDLEELRRAAEALRLTMRRAATAVATGGG